MRGHWSLGLFLFWAGHFCVDLLIGMWPVYKTLMGMDLATAGLMMACAGFFGDMTQLFFGPLGDQKGHKIFIMMSLVLIVPMALVGHMPRALLLPCLLFLYLGSGAFHPNASPLAARLRPHQKGVMISLLLSGGYMGMALGPIAYHFLYQHLGGSTWPLVIPICLVTVAGLIYRAPSQPKVLCQGFWASMRMLTPHKRSLIFLWLSQICCYGVICSFLFVLPDLLKERGYGNGLAFGGGHFFFIVGSALTTTTLGWVADRYLAKRLLPFLGAIALTALALFLTLPTLHPFLLVVVLVLFGGALGLMSPLIITTGHRLAPERGGAIGALLMGGAWCFSYLGPLGVGFAAVAFADNGPLKALEFLGLLLLIPIGLGFFLPSFTRVPQVEQVHLGEPSIEKPGTQNLLLSSEDASQVSIL